MLVVELVAVVIIEFHAGTERNMKGDSADESSGNFYHEIPGTLSSLSIV